MLLDIYDGADGKTLRIELASVAERNELVSQLRQLADGSLTTWRLVPSDAHGTKHIQVFLRVVANRSQEILQILQDTQIEWRRTNEGWLECAELVEVLEPGGATCQYLSQSSRDDAVVEICVD